KKPWEENWVWEPLQRHESKIMEYVGSVLIDPDTAVHCDELFYDAVPEYPGRMIFCAAAPDMYRALKKFLAATSDEELILARTAADMAIKKAEG
ncbi:MAG TPA: hypothetical protein VHM20_08805, partial [Gammaproteobacteria bacterium]|nr:hypothetical protein [Gammaproteobacteria bacterium]